MQRDLWRVWQEESTNAGVDQKTVKGLLLVTFLLNVPDCLRHQQTSKISKILVSHIHIASQLFLRQDQHSQKFKEPWVFLSLLGRPGVWRATSKVWRIKSVQISSDHSKVAYEHGQKLLRFLKTMQSTSHWMWLNSLISYNLLTKKRKCLGQMFVDEYLWDKWFSDNQFLFIKACWKYVRQGI